MAAVKTWQHPNRWIALLAALWLLSQLAAAFHVGHNDADEIAVAEHSCVLCKVAASDDVILASPITFAVSVALFVVAVAVSTAAARLSPRYFQARAPPVL